ncbi:MAG: efflux RND transporter periplasmic adaptor subunit [Lacipirellulaceae bacterium]
MNFITNRPLFGVVTTGLVCLLLGAIALLTRERWLPGFQSATTEPKAEHRLNSEEDHHSHAGHNEAASIELSANALRNISYKPFEVTSTQFVKKLSLPAIVVERPGRSQLHITSPLTGVVTAIHAVPGEAVGPEQPLFDMRLTHEELVAAQRDFLRTAENLDIVNREIARLEGLGEGVVAGRRILEQKYEKQKLEASLRAESEAMRLHGITEPQVQNILKTRRLFRSITVRAPKHTDEGESCSGEHLFQVQKLGTAQGEQVDAGRELAMLSDHCRLHIEAIAFEDDADAIRSAARANRNVTANLVSSNSKSGLINGLEILYVADQIDRVSRAFKIYLSLPNEVALDKTLPDGKRFIEWVYKPGQRLEVSVPIETWENQLVVPTTAVVDDGAESYVYRQNGDHFDQVPVHVVHRDRNAIVIANDGELFPGDVIAGSGAYQMHLALKNQAGGGVDPHAGHNH